MTEVGRMRTARLLMVVCLAAVIAAPAYAQGCGGMRGMGTGMDGGCGMAVMSGMSCGMCSGMAGMGGCSTVQGCPMMILPFLERLDLSDAQMVEIETLMTGFEERIADAREDAGMADPRAAFLSLFASSDFSAAALEDFEARAADLAEEIRDIHVEALVSIHDVLTPAQLEQLAELDPGERGMGMRGGCGMGGMNRGVGGCRGMR